MCGVCLCPCLKVLIRAPLLETVRQWPSSPGLVYASLIGQVYATLTLVSTAHAHTRIFRLFSSLCPGLGASRPELAAPSNSALTVQHSTKQYSHKNTQTLFRSLKEYTGEPYKLMLSFIDNGKSSTELSRIWVKRSAVQRSYFHYLSSFPQLWCLTRQLISSLRV